MNIEKPILNEPREPNHWESALAAVQNFEEILAKKDQTENIEKTRERLVNTIEDFFYKHGATEKTGAMRILSSIAREHPSMIVRRESPKELLRAIDEGAPLHITFNKKDAFSHEGNSYPNAAIIANDRSGLNEPLTRGFGKFKEGIGTFIIGFIPNKHIQVKRLPRPAFHSSEKLINGEKRPYSHYNGKSRMYVRLVQGDVSPESMKFVLFRMPRSEFPERLMTEDELDKEKEKFIYRLFFLNQETKKEGA